jgi:hypothetical protein
VKIGRGKYSHPSYTLLTTHTPATTITTVTLKEGNRSNRGNGGTGSRDKTISGHHRADGADGPDPAATHHWVWSTPTLTPMPYTPALRQQYATKVLALGVAA